MKNILLLFSLITLNSINAQVISYYNEDLKKIDSTTYFNKCYYKIKKCYTFTTKDSISKIVYNKYDFGKLNNVEKNKLENELKFKIEESLVLVFKDTIGEKGYFEESTYYRHRMILSHMIKGKNIKVGEKIRINKTDIDIIMNERQEKKNKCFNKFKRKHIIRLYYNFNKEKLVLRQKWLQDKNKIIKSLFFNFTKNYQFVIIKPDGEYLKIGWHLEERKLKKILKTKNWSKFKIELQKAKENGYMSENNFFNYNFSTKEICF